LYINNLAEVAKHPREPEGEQEYQESRPPDKDTLFLRNCFERALSGNRSSAVDKRTRREVNLI